MENIQFNTISPDAFAKGVISALEAKPELLPTFVEEIEDYLLGKMILQGETGEYVSEEEVMKILKE